MCTERLMSQNCCKRIHRIPSSPQFGDMQNMTDNARLALRDMQRKAFLQKICLYSTIGILIILILLVAYREITNHGKLF